MALASLQSTMKISGRDKVYVAALPFRATTEPFQSVTSALHALHLWDLQHLVVIIKTSSPPSNSKASLFGFQPKDPQNVLALALAALPGGSTLGTLLGRKLTRLPKQRCWFVGYSEEDSLDIALKFNDTWETDWRMGIHDCRNYANGLVECLTSEKYVLERLRRHWLADLRHQISGTTPMTGQRFTKIGDWLTFRSLRLLSNPRFAAQPSSKPSTSQSLTLVIGLFSVPMSKSVALL